MQNFHRLETALKNIAEDSKIAEPIAERLETLRAEEKELTASLAEKRAALAELEPKLAEVEARFAAIKERFAVEATP